MFIFVLCLWCVLYIFWSGSYFKYIFIPYLSVRIFSIVFRANCNSSLLEARSWILKAALFIASFVVFSIHKLKIRSDNAHPCVKPFVVLASLRSSSTSIKANIEFTLSKVSSPQINKSNSPQGLISYLRAMIFLSSNWLSSSFYSAIIPILFCTIPVNHFEAPEVKQIVL